MGGSREVELCTRMVRPVMLLVGDPFRPDLPTVGRHAPQAIARLAVG
jgi:hypothetical protein